MNSMAGYRNRLVHDPHMRRLYSKLRIRSGFAVGIAGQYGQGDGIFSL